MDIIITSVITNAKNCLACNCLFMQMSHVRPGIMNANLPRLARLPAPIGVNF